MIKKIILLAICICNFAILNAQTFQWAKRTGAAGNDVALAITTDAAGNVYSTGYFTGTVDIDPGPATLTFTAVSGSADVFVTKFTSSGTLIWAKQIGGGSTDQGNAIKVDPSGNVYVGGTFATTCDFDPSAATFNVTVVAYSDAFICKLDASGNFVWAKIFGGNGNEQVTAVELDAAGNVHSTGFFHQTCDFDPGPATYNLVAGVTTTQSGVFVSKLDNSGTFIWAGFIGNGQFQQGTSIAVDALGAVYVGGYYIGGTDFDPGAGYYGIPLGSGGGEEGFVCKLTSAGAFTAAIKFSSSSHERVNGMRLDASGNVIATGYFNGTADFDPGAGTANLTTVGLKDIFVAKLTSSLIYVWAKSIGSTVDDMGNAIMSDASDNVYAVGYFQGTADFDPGAGTSNLVSAGGYDAFLVKLSSTGTFSFGKKFGGTAGDYGFGVNVDGLGNSIYSVGHFGGTCDFDPDAGVYNLVSGGTQDLFIQKMGICVAPVAPTSTTAPANLSICYSNSTSLSATGSGTLGWYSASTGGTYLGSGGTYTTPVLTATTSYYVQDSTCSGSVRTQITVTVNPQITSSVSSQINISCNGGANGAATILAGGGTGPYTYAWTPSGGTAATTTGRTAGTYTCTITDAVGCTRTQTVSLTQPTAITSSVSSQTNILCNGGSTGAATVLVSGGVPSYTYAWAPSGGNAATTTGRTAGTYTCTITDANGCTRTQTVTLTQPTAITSSVSSQTNISCNGGSTGAATVLASGGVPSYTYAWTPTGGNAATTTGRPAGTYTCTITDANGCTQTQTVNLTQPTAIASSVSSQTNISCNGGTNGAATILASGGVPSYTYAWAPSGGTAATATGLTAGTYTCTITDANGCARTQTVTLTQPTAIASSVSSQTNISCNGGSNGAATVLASGGVPSYTYAWAPSGGNAATTTGRTAGTYTCTITDANGCTRTQTVSLTQPTAIASSVSSQTNISCNGGSNGSATILASGGVPSYTYAWAPSGGTAATATGLTTGTYTCTITDANGCTRTQTVTLTQPTAITSSVSSQTNLSCNGGSNGTATILASGGTPSYTYSWAPSGGTAATATGLAAGTYTCTVTDANTCSITQTLTLTQPAAIISSVTSQTNLLCNGNNDGAATIAASGGTGILTYTWTPTGGNAVSASGLTAGTYTCTITDANSCTQTQTVSITEPAAIASSVSSANISCNGANDGTANVIASGGTGTLTYSWAPTGGTIATASALVAGTYTCTITDQNGCTTTESVTIIEPAILAATVSSQTDPLCNGSNDGAATIAVTGGTGPNTYAWTPSGGNAASASGLIAGTYTCVVTDANACSVSQTVVLTEPAAIDVTTSTTGNTVSANLVGASYQWIDCVNNNAPIAGATNQVFAPVINGNYAVIITVGGCSDTSVCTSVMTGIEANGISLFTVFPNPTNGIVTVQLEQLHENSYFEVFNATGQLVSTVQPTSKTTEIQLPEAAGIYLVRLNANGKTSNVRVIKK